MFCVLVAILHALFSILSPSHRHTTSSPNDSRRPHPTLQRSLFAQLSPVGSVARPAATGARNSRQPAHHYHRLPQWQSTTRPHFTDPRLRGVLAAQPSPAGSVAPPTATEAAFLQSNEECL